MIKNSEKGKQNVFLKNYIYSIVIQNNIFISSMKDQNQNN